MADPPTHWLYPTNDGPTARYHLEDLDSGDWLPVSPENVWDGLQRHPDRIDDWGLSSGFNIMRPDDAVWLYAAGRHTSTHWPARHKRMPTPATTGP